ncbi:putative bifunctional diguanylate cyclase/phosphodiesterase [Symbioplanes lichenis]|uniref:putative bifunctional diguanylate cyclase/phosphodiesterase n=1 Tax=Symbioplanes lichenis TaxID=1629072 RepID=UPI0027381923|nr:bifunctional diguanylate cyclase/phosphodiesterase [Actinoplanes lichenis]
MTARLRPAPGVLPALAALAAVAGVVGWLLAGHPGPSVAGYAGGPVAMAAAFVSCRSIGAMIVVARPVRDFWRMCASAALCVGAGAVVAFWFPTHERGLSPYVAGPLLLGVAFFLLAFVRLPRERRSLPQWLQVLLEYVTVAVAGSLIFTYLINDHGRPGAGPAVQRVTAVVGVGCLIAVVVIWRAAVTPASIVEPRALYRLAGAPVAAAAAFLLLVGGGETVVLWVSVLAVPVVGTTMSLGAYRQRQALARPRPAAAAPARRPGLRDALPSAAIVAAAVTAVLASGENLGWYQRSMILGVVVIAVCVVARQLVGLRAEDRLLAEVRRQQLDLARQAETDPLTGLANRARFSAVLAERVERHEPATVVLVDLDDFKSINDTMGHAVGDQLLYEVARRLGGFSARLGGDEFAVLLDTDDPDRTGEAAAALLAELAVPYGVGEHLLLANASIGVATAGPGDTAGEVLRNADIAMYQAKEAGKAGWTRFEPRMRQEVVDHARLGSELHNAILRRELHLVYQPVFDLTTGRMAGAEALVRWRHPVRGIVSPADFIPVAERSGLIVPLGSWVLREACEQLAAWQREHGAAAIRSVNVNVAARQLRESGFVDEVAAVLSETGLLPANLVIEVTESSVIEGRGVRDTLQALHDLGVRLALDDFGTGQSSLSLVRAFPVDVLKLDKSFVDGICEGADKGRLAVAAAVAQLAEYLGMYTVAEGIEEASQLERLRRMGYKLGQGYHLAKPLPPDEMAALMVANARAVPV